MKHKCYLLNDPISCAEDDDSRSSYVSSLVQNNHFLSAPTLGCQASIPKVIVQFWDDLSCIPKDVQECFKTWEPLVAQGFSRLIFDDRKARNFIFSNFDSTHVQAFDLCYHPAMRCDYFRLCYILSRGGFYIDADEIYQGMDINLFFNDARLKLQPLCYDLDTGSMIEPKVFMINKNHSPSWIYYFNNNPLISPADHPIICLALERATRILINSRKRPEIQSTTGPGNLTASLVRHSFSKELLGAEKDFQILTDWGSMSISPWLLSYRNDARNWRLSNESN